jgi:hypothetical protein
MDLVEASSGSDSQNRHPWELSRAYCILKDIKKESLHNIIDVGAGDKFFTRKLSKIASGAIYAIDTGYGEEVACVDHIYCLTTIAAIASLNPACTEGGAIFMMDVLEHIENDRIFLKNAVNFLAEDAILLITVPAFQFLFSAHDIYLKHYRRYDRKNLLAIVNSAGLVIEKCHYFYILPFLVRFISRLFQGKNAAKTGIGRWNLPDRHIITKVIYLILNIDYCICGLLAHLHIYIPGLSLLAICRKRGL